MDARTVRQHYTVEIGRRAKDGQRQVQVYRQKTDPATKVPVGDPVIVEDGEPLTLDLFVDVLPELSVDDRVQYDQSGGDGQCI